LIVIRFYDKNFNASKIISRINYESFSPKATDPAHISGPDRMKNLIIPSLLLNISSTYLNKIPEEHHLSSF
jgi:hypothetical protein